jgi:uncharacterized membrane protein
MNNKKKTSKLNLLLSTFLTFSLFNFIDIPISTNFLNTNFNFNQEALAKSRGGRSGGGSFKSRSSSSRSSNSSSTNRTSNSSNYRERNSYRSTDNTIIINNNSYHRSYGYSYGGGSSLLFLLIFFGVLVFIIYLVYAQNKAEREAKDRKYGAKVELENQEKNRKVTISKLQIALMAEAITVSKQLSQLTLSIDTSTEVGLVELLQESIIILLRNSEYWTHVFSRSFNIKISEAEAAFNRLSVAQRSKFSMETVSNINGKFCSYVDENSQQNSESNQNLPAYIVVTILVGSAGKEPLFHRINSTEELKTTLEKLAILEGDDLMKLEILWTPQSENEFLTNDEFILEYTDMIQLI